jgi:hypothetical protein
MTRTIDRRKHIEKKVSDAKYLSKPSARNTVVFLDTRGHWSFEVYLPDRDKWTIETAGETDSHEQGRPIDISSLVWR